MFLAAAAMVRNEADIIEAFVRHNLTVVDRVGIVDHGSGDGTSEILRALVAEGLPLTVARDESVGFYQPEILTGFIRQMLRAGDAQFVFALDADEFLKVPSRDVLEAVLRRVPARMHGLARWVTYVPDFLQQGDVLALLASARRMKTEGQQLDKVVVRRDFLSDAEAFVALGNHRVLASPDAPETPVPHARLPEEAVAVAHVPVRCVAQLTSKIAVGWLAHVAAHRDEPTLSFHWHESFDRLARGDTLGEGDLWAMATNYSVPRAQWTTHDAGCLVADPFLGPITLRYTALARCDPMANVLRFAERLAHG